MAGGMVGMASGEQLRFATILQSTLGLYKPADTIFQQAIGHSVAKNWNHLAHTFLTYPEPLDWLFLTEDDHLLAQNTLMRLLVHDKDIVSGFYVQRIAPFAPVIFDRIDKDGTVHHRFLKKGDHGLVRTAVCGGGCLLIKRRVLETLEPPFWSFGETVHIDNTNHDVNFSRKAAAAGFELWADLDITVDHLMTFPIRPYRHENGTWCTRIAQSDDHFIEVPPAEGA
jgi:hypothetical protein